MKRTIGRMGMACLLAAALLPAGCGKDSTTGPQDRVQVFQFGVADEFTPPGIETTRPTVVENYRTRTLKAPARLEDEASVNTPFLHTFTGLPLHPTGITVELGLRAVGDACTNDVVGFQLIPSDDPDGTAIWQWLWFIEPYTGSDWTAGTERVIRYDLDDLPDGTGGRMSLLDSITHGTLDVVVNDDTAVDYVRVTVRS